MVIGAGVTQLVDAIPVSGRELSRYTRNCLLPHVITSKGWVITMSRPLIGHDLIYCIYTSESFKSATANPQRGV